MTAAEVERGKFIEQLVYQIRRSCQVQLARVQTYLDGIVLAAEQVQDTRISLLESPPPVSGASIVCDVLLTIVLESTLPGKILTTFTRHIFQQPLAQQKAFAGVQVSMGANLKSRIKRVDRNLPSAAAVQLRSSGGVERVLVGLSKASQEADVGKKAVTAYHSALKEMVQTAPEVGTATNATAFAKGAKEWQGRLPVAVPDLTAGDSAGVSVLAVAQEYAAATRLGIEARHALFEMIVRSPNPAPDDVLQIIDLVGWEDLEIDVNGKRVQCDLADLRRRYRVFFEAVIWSLAFGFVKPHPTIERNQYLSGVPDPFTDYWRKRFGPAVDEWNVSSQVIQPRGAKFADLSGSAQTLALQKYFWALRKQFERAAAAA